MSARPSQPPVEVLPRAKALARDVGAAVMAMVSDKLAERGLDDDAIRATMASLAAVAAERSIAKRRAAAVTEVPA